MVIMMRIIGLTVIVFLSSSTFHKVKASNVALLRPAEQSTTFASSQASLAVDGNLETCSSTLEAKADGQRWWTVQLQRPVNVKEVTVSINHGVAFHQQFTVFVIARSGDMRTNFHKCASFAGILRAGQRQRLSCPPEGIVAEKVYIRDDRREGSLSLCEVEVITHSGGICSEPPAISNGRVSVLGGSQQHLKYHCDSGFLLWGASDLVCLGNNTWSSPPPICSPMTCGYPHVEDANALIQKSSYNIQRSQGAQIGDEAIVVCAPGYQMVANSSLGQVEAVKQMHVFCSQAGIWEKTHGYRCFNRSRIAQLWPSMDLSALATTTRLDGEEDEPNFSLHSIIFSLVSIVLFVLFCFLLTCLLRHRRMRAIKRRTETNVIWPRNLDFQQQQQQMKSTKPLISVFTTNSSSFEHKKGSFGSSSTVSLMHTQQLHGGSSAKLIPCEESTATIHAGRSYTKKISYEDDFHLPESGSLVQAIPVDPHSAVFGKHGQRLDDKSVVVAVTSGSTNNEHNGLPDVTSVSAAAVGAAVPAGIGYYHKNTFLSSFQPAGTTLLPPAAASAASPTTPEKGKETHTTSLWQSSSSSAAHHHPPPPPPVIPDEWRTSKDNALDLAPPPEKFTNGDLPELDEAGYASLILKTVKFDKSSEPVYERIKGERPISQEPLASIGAASAAGTDNVSDSGESHAYYSRVAKDLSLDPPPLKEHLYQNFDQVFLAMEEKRQQQHPDLLRNAEGFYENTRSLSPSKEVVVNDEKLRHMYAQVDVIKKHFDRNNKAYQSLQVMDHASHHHNIANKRSSPDLGTIRTAWEEQI